MEVIRYHKHCLCICKHVLILFFYSHQLINGIKALLLNTGSCVKLCLRYKPIHCFVDVLCSVIPVGNRISKHFVVFIQQDKVHSPCVNSHTVRNFSHFQTLFHACKYFLKKSVHIPHLMTCFFCHAVWKAIDFLKHHLSIFHV